MKKILSILILVIFLLPSSASAVNVVLDDGTTINLDGLSDTEKTNMLKYVEKINQAKTGNSLTQSAADVILNSAKDPAKLNEWRKLITGTIKDIANDLNVSVNEFVKTPVGLGVAALIFYRVAGKEMMETIFGIIMAIPLWFVIMIIIGFTTKYFLGHKTEYTELDTRPQSLTNDQARRAVSEQTSNNEKVHLKFPIRVCRYDWQSKDAKTTFCAFMVGIPIVITAICMLIVFG